MNNDTIMRCQEVTDTSMAERYVRGELEETERDAFESHFFSCEKCLDEVESYRTLRDELADDRTAILAESSGSDHRSFARAAGWGVLAVAAAIALFFVVPALRSPVDPWTDLARVDPPSYSPPTLRDPANAGRQRFERIMAEHYLTGNFERTSQELREAFGTRPAALDVAFFLGASSLLAGNAADAINPLQAVIDEGESPYLEEARYFLAKTHLSRKDVDAARRELMALVELEGDLEPEARRLLSELDAAESPR